MSQIKLSPNASGTGVFTIDAPNSNTNRTLTLPDKSGTLVDTSENPFLAYDSWYLTANHTANAVMSGWTRRTGDNWVNIGSAMSESSGLWTFPSTGIWRIDINPLWNAGTVTNDQSSMTIVSTKDNFSTEESIGGTILGGDWVVGHGHSNALFDVEDTTTDKVKFVTGSIASGNLYAGAVATYTWVSYTKLGET